jgi:hypothetical protein
VDSTIISRDGRILSDQVANSKVVAALKMLTNQDGRERDSREGALAEHLRYVDRIGRAKADTKALVRKIRVHSEALRHEKMRERSSSSPHKGSSGDKA